MLLAPCNACNIKMQLRQYFFTYWKDNNIPIIKKQTRQSDRYVINFNEFPSFFSESPSVVTSIQYLLLYDKNKSGSSVSELPKRIWVYHQLQMLRYLSAQSINIFFINICLILFLNFFSSLIYQKVSGKLPPGKLPPIKLSPGKFPPGKFPPRKFPRGIFPPMFLNIPTPVFKFFVFSLLSLSSLILLKRLFSNSMF